MQLNKIGVWLWKHFPFSSNLRNMGVWLLSPKFMVGVVAYVTDDEGRVLLVRHTYKGKSPWGLPGGGLHPDESLEDCVRREVREEAGIEVRVERLLAAEAHYDQRLVDLMFACKPQPSQSLDTFRPSPEISEARFFPLDQLPEGTAPAQRRRIRIALKRSGR
jgi:ADP-ribose pyrophosphatase YjhB (NUDIX family)